MLPLPAVANNVADLATLFAVADVWGLPKENCVQLLDPENLDIVIDAVSSAARDASDTLLIYYAGHGLTHPRRGDKLYLTLPGAEDDSRLHAALDYEYLRDLLLDPAVPATRKIVILDCCWSGRVLDCAMGQPDGIADAAAVEGTFVLTAVAGTRPAIAPPGARHTAFTGELLKVIADGLPGGPPLLDLYTVYRALYRSLLAQGFPTPEQRGRLTAGDIAIARNRAISASPSLTRAETAPARRADVNRHLRLLKRLGRFEAAAAVIQWEASEGNGEARIRLARNLRRSGRFEDALDIAY